MQLVKMIIKFASWSYSQAKNHIYPVKILVKRRYQNHFFSIKFLAIHFFHFDSHGEYCASFHRSLPIYAASSVQNRSNRSSASSASQDKNQNRNIPLRYSQIHPSVRTSRNWHDFSGAGIFEIPQLVGHPVCRRVPLPPRPLTVPPRAIL